MTKKEKMEEATEGSFSALTLFGVTKKKYNEIADDAFKALKSTETFTEMFNKMGIEKSENSVKAFMFGRALENNEGPDIGELLQAMAGGK